MSRDMREREEKFESNLLLSPYRVPTSANSKRVRQERGEEEKEGGRFD